MSVFQRISITALIALFALSNCGFRLKQQADLSGSIKDITLVYKNLDPAFMHQLKNSLEQAGIHIIDDSVNMLSIQRYDERKRTIASDTVTAKPTETQIDYRLSFSFTHDKQLLIAPNELHVSKEFMNNNTDIAGMLDEERNLKKSAQQELIDLLLHRLQRLETIETDHGN